MPPPCPFDRPRRTPYWREERLLARDLRAAAHKRWPASRRTNVWRGLTSRPPLLTRPTSEEQNFGGKAMLAEIYMLRLEAAARAAKDVATSSQFVPITLPSEKAS